MTAAGAPAAPRVAVGPPRPGWPAMYLWLVSALVGWAPPTEAVTRISVTWQRIWPAGGVQDTADHRDTGRSSRQSCRSRPKSAGKRLAGTPATLNRGHPVAGAEHDCSVSLGQWRCSERGGPDPIDTAPRHLSDRTANDRGTRTWPPVTGSRHTAWEIARPTKESAKRRSTTLDLETAAADTHIQPTTSVFRSSCWADGRHTVAARAHDDRLGTWQASVRVSGAASPPVRPATTSRRPRATRRELMCVSALRSVASNV